MTVPVLPPVALVNGGCHESSVSPPLAEGYENGGGNL